MFHYCAVSCSKVQFYIINDLAFRSKQRRFDWDFGFFIQKQFASEIFLWKFYFIFGHVPIYGFQKFALADSNYKLAVPQIRLQCDKIHVAKNFSQSKLWNLFSIMSSSIEKCPFCAAPISAANDQFCRKCGSRLLLECSACHKPVRRSDRFCANCGKRRYFLIEARKYFYFWEDLHKVCSVE